MNLLSTRPGHWRPKTVFTLLFGLLFSFAALAQEIIITKQPVATTIKEGENFRLEVTASYAGDGQVAYQWFFKSTIVEQAVELEGQAESVLSILSAKSSNQGFYSVAVTVIDGDSPEVISEFVKVTVVNKPETLPIITKQPVATTIKEGENLRLDVTATIAGDGLLTYQWFFKPTIEAEAVKVEGQTKSVLSILSAKPSNQGFYSVTVTAIGGDSPQVISDFVKVMVVNRPLPIITRHPVATTVNEGADLRLEVTATIAGVGLLTYQWFFKPTIEAEAVKLANATYSFLSIQGAKPSNQGFYSVTVTGGGSTQVTSEFVKVTVSVLKPGKQIASSGFLPERDGFGFENYGVPEEWKVTNLTPVEMQRLFGNRTVASQINGSLELTPPSKMWMDKQNEGMNGGHCEGMAVLSMLIKDKKIDVTKFGANVAFDLNITTNNLLQREIAYWFVTQSTQPAQQNCIKGTPVEILERLISVLKPEATESYTIGVYAQPPLRGGHAVTPYGVEDMGGNIFHVLVYDNNHAGKQRRLIVDKNKNTWEMSLSTNPNDSESIWRGDSSSKSLEICPNGVRIPQQDCWFCGQTTDGSNSELPRVRTALNQTVGFNELYVDGSNVDVLIVDGQNRRSGYVNGRFVQEIPGVEFDQTKSDDSMFRDDAPPVIRVPLNLAFSVVLEGSRLTNSTASDVVLIGPGYDVAIEGIMLNPGQRDTIVFTPDGTGISYTSSASESPDITLGFEAIGADFSFTVKGVEVDPGSTVSLKLDKAKGSLNLFSTGNTQTPTYALAIGRYEEDKVEEFFHDDIQLAPKDSITIEYGKWIGNGKPVELLIDKSSDGSIDERFMLTDEDSLPVSDVPRLLASVGSNGLVTISWASVDPRFVLEFTTALGGGWTLVPATQVVTAGGSSSYTETASTIAGRFFRLRAK